MVFRIFLTLPMRIYEEMQLFSVFRILGTPNETVWPGVQDLPDFKPTFPHWNVKQLSDVVRGLSQDGCDLLKVSSLG